MKATDLDTLDITPAMLRQAREAARLTPAQAADRCGIHRTSYARQEAGQSRVAVPVYRLLTLLSGELTDPAWSGWRVDRGRLIDPDNGIGYGPGELRQAHWLHQSIRTLRVELYRVTGREVDQAHYHGYRFLRENML